MPTYFDGYVCDGEIVCEHCFDGDPDSPEVSILDGITSNETDSPDHCSFCSRPIHCSLTSEGVKYVLRALREYGVEPHDKRVQDKWASREDNYYHGSPGWALLGDWADQVSWNALDKVEKKIVEAFNELVDADKELCKTYGPFEPRLRAVRNAERRLRRYAALYDTWNK